MSSVELAIDPSAGSPLFAKFFKKVMGRSASRAFWMLSDQAIVSIGNFATANLLARFLLPKSVYGGYQLLLQTLLFFNGLQAALVIYPLTIQAATRSERALRKAATAAIVFTLALLPVLGTGMWLTAGGTGRWTLCLSAVGAMVFWQMQETLRRALVADFRIPACLPGDAISYIGQALAVWMLHEFHHLNLVTAFIAIGGTSLVAMLVQSLQIGLARVTLRDVRQIAMEWWMLGRWALLNSVTTVVTGISFFWVLRYFWRLESVAVFGAISQPLNLTNPIVSSICGLIIPAVARSCVTGGVRSAMRSAMRYSSMAAVMILPVYMFYFLFPTWTLKCFFGPMSPYVQDASFLRLWAFYFIFCFPGSFIAATLAGLKQSRFQFIAGIIHAVTVGLIALPCTAKWGVHGLIWSGIGTTFIDVVIMGYLLRITFNRLRLLPPGDPATF